MGVRSESRTSGIASLVRAGKVREHQAPNEPSGPPAYSNPLEEAPADPLGEEVEQGDHVGLEVGLVC